jgi:uncharacterized protein involved in exopolysaccharide biosynthesis
MNDSADPFLARLIEFLSRHRRFIIAWAVAAGIISTLFAFLITPEFKSSSTVFPAERADLFGALEGVTSLARSFSARSLSSLGANPELDRYMAILRSGKVLGAVIEKFDLVHVYNITSYPQEKTTKKLLENVDFEIAQEGTLTVTVYDRDPQRAADMANFFIECLNKTNTDLQGQNAKGNRQFIEERFNKNLRDLSAAEDSLRLFQKRYGVIAMPEQTAATIKAASELMGQLAAKEIQLAILKRMQSMDSPSVMDMQVQVEELRRKIREMNDGDHLTLAGINPFVPINKIPDYGAEYIRRYREVEIQYKILQFLTPLFEQAKVEEKRQTPSVIVLDKATPAERKSRPKRLYIMMGGVFVGLFFSIALAGFLDWIAREREKQSTLYKALHGLGQSIAADLRFLLPWKFK